MHAERVNQAVQHKEDKARSEWATEKAAELRRLEALELEVLTHVAGGEAVHCLCYKCDPHPQP